jgi:hypothetical protein
MYLVHGTKSTGPREWLADRWRPTLACCIRPHLYPESGNGRELYAGMCHNLAYSWRWRRGHQPWRSSLYPSSFFFLHVSCLFMWQWASGSLIPNTSQGRPREGFPLVQKTLSAFVRRKRPREGFSLIVVDVPLTGPRSRCATVPQNHYTDTVKENTAYSMEWM